MTREEALERDHPKTGYRIRSATGCDGWRWLWTYRNGNGIDMTDVVFWSGTFY
jgi:hypothetical protein